MTAVIARPPLQVLSMSHIQSGSRRHSARLQQKEDNEIPASTTTNGKNVAITTTAKAQTSAANTRKRKNNYDEDDDGFVFSRVKKKKPRQSTSAQQEAPPPLPTLPEVQDHALQPPPSDQHPSKHVLDKQDGVATAPPKKRRKRMSFSTPGTKDQQPARRSKRLSSEAQEDRGSPVSKPAQEMRPPKIRKEKVEKQKPPAQQDEPLPHTSKEKVEKQKKPAQQDDLPQARKAEKQKISAQQDEAPPQEQIQDNANSATEVVPLEDGHSSTKISLPFADTPVISRNKAMREGKSGKGERRSSLGLRGRRASSLIDSGTSNALPHTEVEHQDFYKHIESDLIEPRRMRQLLTWCATRAMHPKPQGTNFEEASARSAARVIEEELLKDLANKSELSDWFSREDAPAPVVPLPERPNPKNVQNTAKITELEEQIKRLRSEKDALEALLRPPSIPDLPAMKDDIDSDIDAGGLSETDANILKSLKSTSDLSADISSRVNKVTSDLGPAIDTFADGVHKINQYRVGADGMANQVLSICAEKLAERERAGRRKALGVEDDRSPGRDLSSVLRGLSKAER